jgi:hypothetical protein
MRQTKYVPGYGYITGSGFLKDVGIELGKAVAKNIGDRIGRKIADKIVPHKTTKEDIIKQIESIPHSSNGLPDDVRQALYGSGVNLKLRYNGVSTNR